ncbi:MAG TPA: hypothetical protein VGG82_15575 [Casimicrobiaceae bacterium]|jgi:hypothetical protein
MHRHAFIGTVAASVLTTPLGGDPAIDFAVGGRGKPLIARHALIEFALVFAVT